MSKLFGARHVIEENSLGTGQIIYFEEEKNDKQGFHKKFDELECVQYIKAGASNIVT